jgi:hypothetical protein
VIADATRRLRGPADRPVVLEARFQDLSRRPAGGHQTGIHQPGVAGERHCPAGDSRGARRHPVAAGVEISISTAEHASPPRTDVEQAALAPDACHKTHVIYRIPDEISMTFFQDNDI